MERSASATGLLCAASTSACLSLATVPLGMCAFFLPIHGPPSASSASHITGGPLLGGQVRAVLPAGTPETATDFFGLGSVSLMVASPAD